MNNARSSNNLSLGELIFDRIIPLFGLIIGTLGLIVAIFAAYYAYLNYERDYEEPNLVLSLYKVEQDKETLHNTLELNSDNLKNIDNLKEFELPLRLGNSGRKDAENIIIWVKANDNATDIQFFKDVNSSWNFGASLRQNWITTNVNRLPPFSGQQLPKIKIRVKPEVKQVSLYWEILASRTVPRSGILIIKLQ